MAVQPLVRLDALLAGDDDENDEQTCVGPFSPEEVLALMREAEANDAIPPSFESGIRLTDEQKTLAIETPLVVIPRAPLLPAIDGADPDDTVVAAMLPIEPAVETAADELARVLDFDWEAHSPKDGEHEPSAPPLELVRPRITPVPREPIPWPETPVAIAPRRSRAVAIAVSLSVLAATLFVLAAWLLDR